MLASRIPTQEELEQLSPEELKHVRTAWDDIMQKLQADYLQSMRVVNDIDNLSK